MPNFSFIILYVADPQASVAFYAGLLDKPVADASPDFAMLPLRDGVMLGLWRRDALEPRAEAAPGSGEIVFGVATDAEVDTTHVDWKRRGLTIAQPPTSKPFGRTFTALDPDGNRLRILHRAG